MEYMTVKQAAEKWGLTTRWIYDLLKSEGIPGAVRVGNTWLIPSDAEKPRDRRVTHGQYVGWRQKHPKKNQEGAKSEEQEESASTSEK